MDRRYFLKTSGVIGATLACSSARAASAAPDPEAAKEFVGVLVDTTRCIGCRACEVACGQTNGMLAPDVEKDKALEKERKTNEKQWTVVNRYQTEKGVFVRKAVHALLAARVHVGLPHHVQDERGAGDLAGRQVHGMPVLHGVVPLRHTEVRIQRVEPGHPEVHDVLQPDQEGKETGVRRGLSGGRARVRKRSAT